MQCRLQQAFLFNPWGDDCEEAQWANVGNQLWSIRLWESICHFEMEINSSVLVMIHQHSRVLAKWWTEEAVAHMLGEIMWPVPIFMFSCRHAYEMSGMVHGSLIP